MEKDNCKQTDGCAHPQRRSALAASAIRPVLQDMPMPDAKASARSDELTVQLRREIEHDGPLPFSRYMDRVLYTPDLGYYGTDSPKFGPTGDFLTAPEISPLFAHCLASLITGVLGTLDADEVLEIGAGSGILAADLLQALEGSARPLRRYAILETSAALRRAQKSTLLTHAPSLADRVCWLDSLPEAGFRGVILANEVLDAMPASRFRITREGVKEWHVGWQSGRFVWTLARPANAVLEQAVAAIERDLGKPLAQGYDSEVHLRHSPWVHGLAERLAAGLILLIDYGYGRREYYHPQRNTGTLVCYYRHWAHTDPLLFPGLQDISVHVDFTTVADAAQAAGLDVAAYTTQASFLLATGLTERLAEANTDGIQYRSWARQAKQLVLPGEMGELVKVMALTRGISAPLQDFGWFDLRNRL